ncbi:putative transcription factor interactor and regulator CCHC(Zn) family [Helianthus annuus]|nr:putative transcription factor interactor and regulator CCHC(Zn) family [Helianthus annuus]
MAIEEYSWWAKKFEEWLKAFAYPSCKSLKNGYNDGGQRGENLTQTEDIENFVAEQKCIALLFQSVRETIISLIKYKNATDLWKKLEVKCLGSAEIVKKQKEVMIERFGHLKLELARHGIVYSREELVDKLFDKLPDEMDWQYFALMLKNTIKSEDLTVDLLIERLESHELEIKKSHKVNHSSYQQNLDLYYPKRMIPKNASAKTAFSAENSNTSSKESSSSGFHSGSSTTSSQSAAKNLFQCNIAVDLKNAQNFSEESAKQQTVFLASVLESYESLVAGKIGNTNLTKEYYNQIDPKEMELIDIRWCMASAVRRAQRFMEIIGRKSIGGPSTNLGFDKSKVTCFKCKQKGHFKREC